MENQNEFYLHAMKISKRSYGLLAVLALMTFAAIYQMNGINGLQASFGAKPDLTITTIAVDSSNILSVTQANTGGSSIAKTTAGVTEIYIDDTTKPVYTYNWTTLTDQKFLLSKNKSVLSTGPLTAGSHVVRACIDSTKIIVESNEVNNCATVRTGGDSDLSVEFVDSAESSTVASTLTDGENIVGILAVTNNGSEGADLTDLDFQYKGFSDKSSVIAVTLKRIEGTTKGTAGTIKASANFHFKELNGSSFGTDYQVESGETAYFEVIANLNLSTISDTDYIQLSMEDLQDLDSAYNGEDGNVKWLVGATEETAIIMGSTKRIEAEKITKM